MQIARSKDWWLSKAQAEPKVPIGAGLEQQNFASVYRPTLAERFWRKMGFRYHLQDLPEDAPTEGWAVTHIRLNVLAMDRFRLLMTGRMRLDVRQAFNTPVDTVVSASSLQILYPGEQF